MYIVPIAVHDRSPGVKQVSILLERNGTHLMTFDSVGSSPLEFAESNGIILAAKPIQTESLIFLPVDIRRTDFSAFYTWREVPPGTTPPKDVWRQFVWVSESLDVNVLLDQIVVGEAEHSIYRILNAYLKTNH